MCPDQKLEWFKEHKFTKEEIRHLKTAVISYWGKKYGSEIIAAEVVDTQHKAKVYFLLFYIYFCLIFINSIQNGNQLRLPLKRNDPMITLKHTSKSQ